MIDHALGFALGAGMFVGVCALFSIAFRRRPTDLAREIEKMKAARLSRSKADIVHGLAYLRGVQLRQPRTWEHWYAVGMMVGSDPEIAIEIADMIMAPAPGSTPTKPKANA